MENWVFEVSAAAQRSGRKLIGRPVVLPVFLGYRVSAARLARRLFGLLNLVVIAPQDRVVRYFWCGRDIRLQRASSAQFPGSHSAFFATSDGGVSMLPVSR